MTDLLETIWRNSVGFDSLLNQRAFSTTAFPFFNITKLDSKDTDCYAIDIALAGYNISDIDISVVRNTLTITSEGAKETTVDGNIIHRGFTSKPFTRSFTLRDNVEVIEATMDNGVLKIVLEHIVPKESKLRKIEINSTPKRVQLNG